MKLEIQDAKPFWFGIDLDDPSARLLLRVDRDRRTKYENYLNKALKKPLEKVKGLYYKLPKPLLAQHVSRGLMEFFIEGSEGQGIANSLALELGMEVTKEAEEKGYVEYDCKPGNAKHRSVYTRRVLERDTHLRELLEKVTAGFETLDEYREANGIVDVVDDEQDPVLEEDTHPGNLKNTVTGGSETKA